MIIAVFHGKLFYGMTLLINVGMAERPRETRYGEQFCM